MEVLGLMTAIHQGTKGIRQWPINWCTTQMMIHKITPSVVYNFGLKRYPKYFSLHIKYYSKSTFLKQRPLVLGLPS